MNEYSYNLKKILNFTKIKYSVFAKAVGYDISYISKWVHGIRLPATRNIDIVNQNAAHYLAAVIFKQNQASAFAEEYMIAVCNSEDELSQKIYCLLSTAYRNSIKKKTNDLSTEGDARVYLGHDDCFRIFQQLLKQYLENTSKVPTIIMTGDFFDLDENAIWQLLANVKLKTDPCNIHVMLNLNNLRKNKISFSNIVYHWLDILLDYQFTIFEKTEVIYDNIVAVKNQFVFLYYLNSEHKINMSILITKKEQVNQIYNRCEEYMLAQPALLLPKKTLGMKRFGYRDMFFTSNQYFYFLTHGFEFLLPDEVFESLVQKANEGTYDPIHVDEKWIRRIQVIWKNLMNKAELHLVLPSNAIIEYLETGYIHLTDFSYKLTLEERKLHIKQVLKVMKLNPKIRFGVLMPAAGKYSYGNFANLSFYSNYTTAFFKKNLCHINEDTAPIYMINNSELLQCFQEYFENLINMPIYREYTYENLINLYDTYHYLLNDLVDE